MYVQFFIFLSLATNVLSAKILALMVVPSHSHHLWNVKYLEALAKRGHEITYLSVDKYTNKNPNIRNVWIEKIYEDLYAIDFTEFFVTGSYYNSYLLCNWIDEASAFQMNTTGLAELKNLIKVEKFDLVVHDIASSLFLLGAVDVLGKPPVIAITAFGIPTVALEVLGNPVSYSSMPNFYETYSDGMNFLERANNYFLYIFSYIMEWYYLQKQKDYAVKTFGPAIRPLDQIINDINIVMVNSNDGVDYPFPKVPGLIPIGGIHITEPKPLPKDLQEYLDNSKDGVIYFSLGSNIKSIDIKKKTLEVIIETFQKLSPINILWKWESDHLPGKPDNVKISKWLPQNDILAHPNVRAFFTHSGMLSTQEAIYHGKPIIAMPFFLDQHVNAAKCVRKGFGEILDFNALSVEKAVKTIKKVLNEPRYTENVKKASALFRDQMQKPIDTAVYWTEYAIRHKGAPHFRHATRNLSWYQNWMLDVFLVFISIIFIILLFVYKSISVICHFFVSEKSTTKKLKKK